MYLDHLYVREEVVAMMCMGDTLRLSLHWCWEDIPLLLTLPVHLQLRWTHVNDPRAGIPVTVERWRWKPHGANAGRAATVELHLRLAHLADC